MPLTACHPELRALPIGPMALPPGSLPFAGLTALLVEDSRFAAEGLRLMWRRGGGRLRRAETLAQARLHWRTYRPDVVIVDLGLPDGRGEDLIRDLVDGSNSAVSGKPALILGLSGDPDGRAAALAAGAGGFLEKPLPSFAQFQSLIELHLPRSTVGGAASVIETLPEAYPTDGLGLRDDLLQVLKLLQHGVSDSVRSYIARFLIGLARTANDSEMQLLGENFANGTLSPCTLTAMIEARLVGGARL